MVVTIESDIWCITRERLGAGGNSRRTGQAGLVRLAFGLYLGTWRDLNRAEQPVPLLVQHGEAVLIDYEMNRLSVGGKYGVAVPIDEVLAG
jgi:hypothetical protein